MIGSNVDPSTAVESNRAREMAVFDALPPAMQLAFREASQNYTVIPQAEALVRGAPVARVLSAFLAEDRAVVRETERRIARGDPPLHIGGQP